ncbi:MAG TPA: twin-arginine translocase subunit TatC [Longimicrobiales bacterium]|nr:twin-arginine translocase subunit TatC [Longimicrobiales bacterium]
MKFWGRTRKSDEMPFLEHLEELRWRILWSLLALVVGTVIGFVLVSHFDVLGLLIRPVEPYVEGGKLRYLSPADPFLITLKLAVTAGILLAFPIVMYELWSFVSPALMPSEKRAIVPSLYFGLVLFIGGMALAYFGVLPIALRFFSQFQTQSLEQNITIGPYLGLVVKLLLGFGLVFETPVIMLVLGALGIVTSDMLRHTRRYAIVIIFVVAAVLTPPDIFSQSLMAVPLLVLFEVSIWLVKWTEKRRARALADMKDDDSDGQWAQAGS